MSSYRGIVNEGSTCYLNSLLQTLFMTPQFKQNVYNYVHDERKISAQDSIPYQLQKLFVLLQLNENSVYSKGLLKSFGWTDYDSFQQHDVQQFCRVLFEALEKASKGNNWIQKLYSGLMQSYVSCGQHPRSNQQIFMDISLPVRNLENRKCYQSIEQCLKEYLKPQNLQDKIDCEWCGEKVKVEKGMRLLNIPPILTLQVNRFDLNYETMQREKINSFLYFPQILELWRFMVPYDQIEVKGMPKDLYDKIKLSEIQKSTRATDFSGSGLSVVGKKIERKKSFEIEAQKKQIKFFDQENRDKRSDQTKKLTVQQQKMKNLQILKDLKADKINIDEKLKNEKAKVNNEDKKQVEKKKQPVMCPASSIQEDFLFGSFMDGFDISGKDNLNDYEEVQVTNLTQKKSNPKFQKTDATFLHQQQAFDINKQYPDKTYVLFSILVHSGGAYGGHYYAYIFDGTSWYCFNDNNVRKVPKQQIRKYGHPTEQSTYGANAYLLFYREAKTFKNLPTSVSIPQLLIQKVRNDKTPVETQKKENEENGIKSRYQQLQKSVVLKIKYLGQIQTLVIQDRHLQSLRGLKNLLKGTLNIEGDDSNWRIRRYNKSEDSMHEIYDIPTFMERSLDEVGLRDTCYVAIQKKGENQQFQEYDPRNITIKLNVWRADLTLLTQTFLKPTKIGIRQQKSFAEFYAKVESATKIKNPVIIKRNFSVGRPYVIFELGENREKSLLSLKFFNGINLYIEESQEGKLKWPKQFEDEKYKCQIKFNNPKVGEDKIFQLFIDTRKTLGELKQRLSELIGISPENFRIKKSQQAVSQMTSFKKRLTDLKFVNVQYIFLEQGKSSKGTVIIRKGVVSVIDDQIDYSLGQQFQIQIVQEVSNVAGLKLKLSEKYNVSEMNIRIRQYRGHQFSQIFMDSESLLKIREKSLIWQQLEDEDPKGLQIYFRVFDLMTLELGPLQSIFVENSALLLQEQTQIPSNKILCYKAPTSFVDKSLLFECQWREIRYAAKSIRDEPLYLNTDGEYLIIKEAEAEYHPKPNRKAGSEGYEEILVHGGTREGKKQKGLKITVVEQKQENVEQANSDNKIQKVQINEGAKNE